MDLFLAANAALSFMVSMSFSEKFDQVCVHYTFFHDVNSLVKKQ